MGSEPAARRVCVAVLTYRRLADLRAVVPAVVDQIGDVEAGDGRPYELSVLVVDNDPEGSALDVARELDDARVRVVHEPEPGISAARNRALDECSMHDAIVFIDDDERPRPGWLRALLGLWAETGADAVVGPVVSELPTGADRWVTEGALFVRQQHPTGTRVAVAATNNILLDLRTVRRLGLRFDHRFGITGGSDTMFTRQLHRAGGVMVWCAEAVVTDVVPPSRATKQWTWRRALRLGNTWSQVELALEDRALARVVKRAELVLSGAIRIGTGVARLTLGAVVRSTRYQARGARTLARGIGFASGALGYRYAEYRRAESG